MIQYAYYHNGKEYVLDLSLNRESEEYEDRRALFEAARAALGKEGALYAPLGEDFVLMRAFSEGGRYSVNALLGGITEVAEMPVRYLGGMQPVSAGYKGNGRLPELRRADIGAVCKNAAAALPGEMFARLFDAFTFGSAGQIILRVRSYAAAESAVSALCALLPLPFVRREGVCILHENVPEAIAYTGSDGAERRLPVRLFAVYGDSFDYNTYAADFTVFDAAGGRDNYARPLTSAALALGEIGLSDWRECERFGSRIAPAFTAGGADTALAERLAAVYRFERGPDPATARAILAQPAEDSTVAAALRCLLRESGGEALPPADAERIRQEFARNDAIASAIEPDLCDYCISHYRYLSAEDKELFARLTAADGTGAHFADFLNSARNGDYRSLAEAFPFVRQVLSAVAAGEDGIRRAAVFLRSAVDAFDIRSCFRIIPMEQRPKGEDFFREAARADTPQMRALLAAVLMCSAYYTGDDRPADFCEQRVRGLRLEAEKLSLHGLDTIAFLLTVRADILEMAEEADLPIDEKDFDFLFNCKAGENWVRNVINQLPVSDMLTAEAYVRSHSAERRNYESMYRAILAKLCKPEYIRKNIGTSGQTEKGRDLRARYTEFFETLPEDERPEEIAEFLVTLNHESDVDDRFARYRYDFAAECCRTMQESDRRQVCDDGRALPYEQSQAKARQQFVERTIETFGTVAARRRRGPRPFSPIGLWAFFLGMLALAAMFVPAAVIPAVLGTFDWPHICEKFLEYFLPAFAAIPLAVFALDVIAYFCFKEGNRVLRANVAALLCGVLPALLFSVGYIVCYFVMPQLPFAGL